MLGKEDVFELDKNFFMTNSYTKRGTKSSEGWLLGKRTSASVTHLEGGEKVWYVKLVSAERVRDRRPENSPNEASGTFLLKHCFLNPKKRGKLWDAGIRSSSEVSQFPGQITRFCNERK